MQEDLRGAEEDPARFRESVWVELHRRLKQLAPRVAGISREAWLDPSDLVSQTLARLLTLNRGREAWFERLGSQERLDGYLYAVLRRAALDERKRVAAREHREAHLDALTWTEPPSTEDFVTLEKALRQLGEDERELLRLRFWEGLTIREIAARLQLGYSATSVRLFRLLRRLRGQVEPGEM